MKTRILALYLLLLFSGCEKEADQNPTIDLVSLVVDASFGTASSDDWLVVHDGETGESVAFVSFEADNSYVLQTDKKLTGNRLSVTWVQHREDVTPKFRLTTYTDIELGRELVLRSFNQSGGVAGTKTGMFKVQLDLPGIPYDQMFISNRFGDGCGGSGTDSDYLGTCQIANNADKFLVQASTAGGDLRYMFVENPQPNITYTADFNQMDEFDKVTTFNFPQSSSVFLLVTGREENQPKADAGYVLSLHYQSDTHTSIRAGYLNSLGNYITNFNARVNDGGIAYYSSGIVPPATVSWPSVSDFTVTNNSIKDFLSSSVNPVVYTSAIYSYTDPANTSIGVGWSVYCPNGKYKLQDLPAEILTQHPLLRLDNMVYSSTTFYLEAPPYGNFSSPDPEQTDWVFKSINRR